MTESFIAFATIGYARNEYGSSGMRGFEWLIASVYREAERSEGFIDRARGIARCDCIPDSQRDWGAWGPWQMPNFEICDPDISSAPVAPTLSIWNDIASVQNFAYRSPLHKTALSRRGEWFYSGPWPSYVMWSIKRGETPTWRDASQKFEALYFEGPSQAAFTFRSAA